MNWKIEEKNIVDLFLDQENIRTPISNKDQNALIQDMFVNEAAIELVKSYNENGVFPDEFPIVIREKRKLIVIEGNRRLASLKGMMTPSIIPQFEKEIKRNNRAKIDKIRVVLAPSRKAAIKHIANKHTINLRRNWKPLRQAYFYKSLKDNGMSIQQIIKEYPQHNVVRFIKMLEMHKIAKSVKLPEEQKIIVHDDRNYPITNLERFYEDQKIQNFFGFEFMDTGEVKIKVKKTEFKKGFKRLIEDTADGTIDSRKYNTAKDRGKYISNFPKPSAPNTSKEDDLSSDDFKELPKPKAKKSKKPRKLKTLFKKSDIPFNLKSSSLKIVYDELASLSAEDFPNATCDLLRSFLECSLVVFLKETGDFSKITKNNSKHNPSIGQMLTFITSGKSTKIQDQNLIDALKLKKDIFDTKYSVLRMHGINHNENYTSSTQEVRSIFGLLENLFKVILNP